MFPSDVRFRLVQQGTAHLANVAVARSQDYLIPYATFPTYFIKDRETVAQIQCKLDLKLFVQSIAPHLNIGVRFVGQALNDPVTTQYNKRMKELFLKHRIQVAELPHF